MKEPGDVVYAESLKIPVPDSDGSTAAGDAVALASGDLAIADAASNERLGVRASGALQGDQAPVVLDGVVIAAVASGVAAGTRVGIGSSASSNAGLFVASSGGPAVTLSGEGGTYKGASLPTGYAAVAIA